MRVRSTQTGLEHDIPKETWDKMKENGSARKYTVVGAQEPPEVANMKVSKKNSKGMNIPEAVELMKSMSIEDIDEFVEGDERKGIEEAVQKIKSENEIDNE